MLYARPPDRSRAAGRYSLTQVLLGLLAVPAGLAVLTEWRGWGTVAVPVLLALAALCARRHPQGWHWFFVGLLAATALAITLFVLTVLFVVFGLPRY